MYIMMVHPVRQMVPSQSFKFVCLILAFAEMAEWTVNCSVNLLNTGYVFSSAFASPLSLTVNVFLNLHIFVNTAIFPKSS